MTDKLVPKNPEEVMVIKEVLPNITTLSVPFARFGRIKVGGRGTLVKLRNGSLAVFSPVALTPAVKGVMGSSPVSYLIAPDMEHHIFLSSWASSYPSAKILGPEDLAKKRAESNKSDKSVTILPFHTAFSEKNKRQATVDADFDAEFEYEYVHAHMNKELVFFHKPTRTLLQADLLFNLPATEQYSKAGVPATQGIATKLFGGIMNTRGSAIWQKRMMWYVQSASDRPAFNESVKRIHSWGVENIIPCHGDSMIGNGGTVFEKVFEWHLKAGKK